MALTSNTAIRITELDFDSIKQNLKDYLKSQSEFQDYDFEGSGMSVLLDILAYNTHYMAFYLNMIGNEMFIDSAQLRQSVLSLSKLMNYVPRSRQGATSKIDILLSPSGAEVGVNETPTPNYVTLEKYTRLIGRDLDGVNYPFVTIHSNTTPKILGGQFGSYAWSNIVVKQGEVTSLQFVMEPTNTYRRFEIPSANVDLETLSVIVQESTTNTDSTIYNQSKDLTTITSTSPVYYIEENDNGNFTLYFGDDVLGKKPKIGSVIFCTYLDNQGAKTNAVTNYAFVDPIGGLYKDNVIITNISSSTAGLDKETVDDIRFRAPYFYTTQNRAVTKQDYETLLLKDYSYIDSVSVWGGEDNDPVVYGKVFFSIKTKENFELSLYEKERIKNDLIRQRGVLTVTPEIIDPNYVYLRLDGKVTYNPSLTQKSAGEIQNLVKAAVADYTTQELNKYTSTFRKSKLIYYIDNCDKSITGSDIQIYAQKRFLVDLSVSKRYEIDFGMQLRKPGGYSEYTYSFPEIQIYDASNILRYVFLEPVPESLTGIESIQVTAFGINYLTPPKVVITGDGTGATATASIVNSRVSKIDITNPGENYSSAAIGLLSLDAGTGATAIAKLQSKSGRLRSYYFNDKGEKIITNSNVGSIDYETGKVVLYSLKIFDVLDNSFYRKDYLTISIPVAAESIYPIRNRILTIDEYDPKAFQINVIAE